MDTLTALSTIVFPPESGFRVTKNSSISYTISLDIFTKIKLSTNAREHGEWSAIAPFMQKSALETMKMFLDEQIAKIDGQAANG